MRFKILLAAPSILYAPVYLAKQLTLSKEFAHVDFEYPKSGATDGRDVLVNKLLLTNSDTNAIMAIADPVRTIGVCEQDSHYEPYVPYALIDKLCLWKIGDYPKECDARRRKIIVHPKGMTAYAITYNDLIDIGFNKTQINRIIYDNIEPGYEREWYERPSLLLPQRVKKGYVTSEPLDVLRATDKHLAVNRFKLETAKSEDDSLSLASFAFTGIIVRKDEYSKDKNKKDFVDGIARGIHVGIRLLNEDIELASEILVKYPDRFDDDDEKFWPKSIGWEKSSIRTFLKEIAIKRSIYAGEMKFDEEVISNSISIWKKTRIYLEHHKHIARLNYVSSRLKEYFNFNTHYFYLPEYRKGNFEMFH